ncbi:hypothetical protein [Streptomyces avermitilis]|uniref:hypothetical protein n=1 Tax=Streptomyces avermitilis TaxID=33903 RepID=UPI0033DFF656
MSWTEILANGAFRGAGIPAVGVGVSTIAKWNMRADSSKEKVWEIFAMGPDLIVIAIMAIPAIFIERAVRILDTPPAATKGQQSESELLNQAGMFLFAIILIFCLTLMELTYERNYGRRMRQAEGRIKPFTFGVLTPILLGGGALAIAFTMIPA